MRLLFSLQGVFMPTMAPPIGVIDTGGSIEALRDQLVTFGGPEIAEKVLEKADYHSKRFLDPATLQIHPYVRHKYLAPLIANWIIQQPPPRESDRQSRVYPVQFISPENFDAGGLLAWPYESAADVIRDVAELIGGQLADWRTHKESFERSVPQTAAVRLSPLLRAQLVRLAGLGIDVPLVYGTLYYSGTALLQAQAFYDELERRRRALRREIRKDKQSLRVHLHAWMPPRCDPDTFERLQRHKKEIFDSLDVIYQPTEEAVRSYRRKLGVSPRKAQPAFWTSLIRWAVKQLDQAGMTRMRAFRAVATLLHELWPTIHRNNVRAVKAAFYRSRK